MGHETTTALSTHEIILAGLTLATEEFCFIRANPEFYQLLIALSGHGHVYVNGEWHRCTMSQAYITPPGKFHAYHTETGGRWKVCWVQFDPGSKVAQLLRIKDASIVQADGRPLAAAIEGLWRENLGAGDPSFMQRWADLVDALCKRIVEPQHLDTRLITAWEAVDGDLSHNWTVEEISKRAGMSSEHFRRLCLVSFKRSPMRQVAELRMRHAASLIGSTALTIEAIAYRVGYENPFAFSTAFRRVTGTSPSEYRRARNTLQ